MERFAMPEELVQEMCTRLGVAQPTDMVGVTELYRAWCAQVPFDSISKALALREGTLPPGGNPADLCERWLVTGLGGTCWGHTSAMAAVLEAGDVHCRVGLDRFLVDDRVDFHSFLVVEEGGRRLGLDVTHGSGDPLPLAAGATGNHPAYPTAMVDDGDGRLLHTFVRMSRAEHEVGTYVVLSIDLDASDLRTFCEVSRTYGMRSRNLYHRRFTDTEMIDCRPADDGSALILRHVGANDEIEKHLADPEEAFAAIGLGPGALDIAVRAGLVERRADRRDLLPAPRQGLRSSTSSTPSFASASGTSVRARSAIEPRRNRKNRQSPAITTMAAAVSTIVPVVVGPASGSVMAPATRTRWSTLVTVPRLERHRIRTCSSIVTGSDQTGPLHARPHDLRGTRMPDPIPAGTLVYGMQLPIQSQSTIYAEPWEAAAGVDDLAAIAQAADRAGVLVRRRVRPHRHPEAPRREDEHLVVGHGRDARLPGGHHRAGPPDEPRLRAALSPSADGGQVVPHAR